LSIKIFTGKVEAGVGLAGSGKNPEEQPNWLTLPKMRVFPIKTKKALKHNYLTTLNLQNLC
jgi:hypothetical protein